MVEVVKSEGGHLKATKATLGCLMTPLHGRVREGWEGDILRCISHP